MSILDNLFSHVKPVAVFSRTGSSTDPYQQYTDNHVVDKNRVVLREIPSKKEKVFITLDDQPLYETPSTQPKENQYYVDYTLGLVIFHSSKNGLSLKFVYKGTGCVYFAADRVVIDYDEDGKPVQTLQQLVDKSKADLEADRKAVAAKIAEMNVKILETETARQNAITATNNAQNAADHANNVANSLDHKGEYDSALTYKERNMVDHDGATFIAMQDVPVNTPPSNITYWRMLSNRTTINEQSWIAKAGQTVFEITNGSYKVGKKHIRVTVGGVPQKSGEGFIETSSTSITINGIEEGMQVDAWWFEGGISIFHGHADTHYANGADELDITKFTGYETLKDELGRYAVNEETWIATEGQTKFTLTNGKFNAGEKQLEVHLQGSLQERGYSYTESADGLSFTFTVPLQAGNRVTAKWVEGAILNPSINHAQKHKKGGSDELNVIDLAGYQENIKDKIDVLQRKAQWVDVLYPKPPLVGAIGDGIADDGNKINAIIQTLQSGDILYFPSGKNFLTTSTISIPVNINVTMNSPLTYRGAGQALVIGQSGSSNNRVNLKLEVIKDSQSDWTSEESIGIKLINCISSSINVVRSQGFTIGMQCIGAGGGFVYNEISLGDMRDNKIGVDCTNETNNGIGWCNENQFINGRFWCGSTTNLSKSRYGVRITSKDGTYVVNNNNNFLKPSFELKEPNTGEAIPVLVEHGEQNAFKDCRNESNSVTFARVSNNSTENVFTTGYGFVNVEDNSNFPSSFSRSRREESSENMNKLIFNSGSLKEKTCLYDGLTTFNIAGMFMGNSGNASVNKALTGITINTNSITVSSSRAIGIRVPTSSTKRFVVRRDVNPTNAGRISIRCYDANLSLLYNTSTAYVKGKSNRVPVANAAFGGVYRMGSVSQQDFFFVVKDEVKFIDVLFSEGEISSMSIYTDAANLTTPFNPLTEEKENLALTPPEVGKWNKGKRVYNDDLFAGGYVGWICVQSGEFGTATQPVFKPFGVISE